MYKIVFLATNEEMMEIGHSALWEFREELDIRLGLLNEGVEVAKKLDREGVDAIISRGGTAYLIKQAAIKTPIIEIAITGQDLALAIYEAKKLLRKEKLLIGVVAFENMIKDINIFSNIFHVKMIVYKLKSMEDIKQSVIKAMRDGVDVILGGITTSEIAKKYNIPTVFLSSREDSIKEAFKIAKQVAYGRALEKKKSQEQKTILDYSSDAIIYINDKAIVTVFNAAAERFFKVKSGHVIGSNIFNVIDAINEDIVNKVLKQGEGIFGMIIKASDTSLVLNFNPITINNEVTGAILTFQEIEQIQKMEARIRKEMFLKGHFAKYNFKDIIGESNSLRMTKHFAEQFARHDSTVLIVGETGTGKELFAQSIHNSSLRSDGPFVAVNCGALPSNLLESELFGYVEGAFTGAVKKGKRGFFDIAHSGTIFLDEISEMDLYGQSRLLRVIQERQIIRLGDDKVTPIDVRIIAATNKNLLELVKQGKFREDLYYRLNVLTLNIPPLRERKEDILSILNYYINEYGKKFFKYIELTENAKMAICNYSWNGNARELRSFCEKLVATAIDKVVSEDFVRIQLENRFFQNKIELISSAEPDETKNLSVTENLEREQIIKLLQQYDGNRSKVAKELGIGRTTLWRKLKQYGIKQIYLK